MGRKGDILLLGGAAIGIGLLGFGVAYLAFAQGPALTLTVQPTEVQQGSGTPVVAQGTYEGYGTIYMRVKHPNGLYEPLPPKSGPSFAEVIPTTGKPAGDYVVEASDNLQFF